MTFEASILVMCLSSDCYIKVIHSLMTVLLEYIDLNEYSLLKIFVCFKFKFEYSFQPY